MPYAKTGQRAEQRDLRDRMRDRGLSHRQIAFEFARRYNMRPRAAWRHAHGWSLKEAAQQINACAAQAGVDPRGTTVAMTGPHLCETENWPGYTPEPTGRRPTPYLLSLLATAYACDVADLLDLADYEHTPPADLLVLASGKPAQGGREDGDRGLPAGSRPSLSAASSRESAPAVAVAIPDRGQAVTVANAVMLPVSDQLPEDEPLGGAGAVALAVADEIAEAARWAEVSNVGDDLLGYLDGAARQIARDYQRSDPAPVVERGMVLAGPGGFPAAGSPAAVPAARPVCGHGEADGVPGVGMW